MWESVIYIKAVYLLCNMNRVRTNTKLLVAPCCRKSETDYETRRITPQFILALQLRSNTNANFHYGHLNYINDRVFGFAVTAVVRFCVCKLQFIFGALADCTSINREKGLDQHPDIRQSMRSETETNTIWCYTSFISAPRIEGEP